MQIKERIDNLEVFLKDANALLYALTEYDKVTNELYDICTSNTWGNGNGDGSDDSEVDAFEKAIIGIEVAISRRETLRNNAELARISMVGSIEGQSDDDTKLIKYVFNNLDSEDNLSPVMGETFSLSGDKSLAVEAIRKLLTLQKSIVEKDSVIIDNLTLKRNELRDSLKNLQSDKKKLDFLSLAATGGKDVGFEA